MGHWINEENKWGRDTVVRDVLRKCAEGAHGRKSKVFCGFWVNLLRRKAKRGSRGDVRVGLGNERNER